MSEITRRSFMGMAAAAAASAGLGAVAAAEEATGEATPALQYTSPEVEALGGSTLPVEVLNQMREEYVASKGDYTCEDGTVVSEVWVKLRALVNTYGYGIGSETPDTGFEFLQMVFQTEEDAQAYLDMPWGVLFTAADFAAKSGRPEDECAAIAEDLAERGLLWRARRAGVAYYHQVPFAHGMYEYNLDCFYEPGWIAASRTIMGGDVMTGMIGSGTTFYYAVPVGEEVVADEKILPHDDWQAIVERNEVFGVSPCQCRLSKMVRAEEPEPPAIGTEELKEFRTPLCGHYLETCISIGEEAAYYIERGIARQVTRDEARAILQRSVDDGMVIQSAFTKDSEILCCCHGDCCGILGAYVALGPELFGTFNSVPNTSNYLLEVDDDACIKCGACIERCPMFAISFDEATGYTVVNELCMRCGQCGLVCPAGARKLTAKPAEQRLDLPEALLDDYNLQASYRFEHGTIY